MVDFDSPKPIAASLGWRPDPAPTLPQTPADVFLAHYTQPGVITRYLPSSAAPGIHYVVKHVYGAIYHITIGTIAACRPQHHEFRILEYGCGGGMNLLQLIQLFRAQGARLASAIGTDFSWSMIKAARNEAEQHLSAEMKQVVQYFLARNETIAQDLGIGLGRHSRELHNTFDLILGVNTFRYTYRLKQDGACARDLFALLQPGGCSIMIDMNRGLQFRGSRIHGLCKRAGRRYYIPSLAQYSRPFQEAGFRIICARTFFCFTHLPFVMSLPGRLNTALLALCRRAKPMFDTCLSRFAKHSLVIARKPFVGEQ
jgi:SAM-dependent methyltransferase